MLTFLKKDLLLFWRDRKEVLLVVILPLLIIVVLSISMSGMFDGDENLNVDLSLGLVIEDQPEEAIEVISNQISMSGKIPEDVKDNLINSIESAPPVELLTNALMSPGIGDWVTVKTLTEKEAVDSVENGGRDAMLVIPSGYTEQLLSYLYLGTENKPELSFSAKETSFEVDIIHDTIEGILNQMNLQYALSLSGTEVDMTQIQLPEGSTESIAADRDFTMGIDQYFTLSMGVLFVLFMASTVATRITLEKREQTFNRVTLSNAPPYHFLFGKTCATFILAMLQIILIFMGSHLILDVFSDRTMMFWSGLLLISIVFSLAVAGLAALMTSISLRIKNPETANGAFTGIIMLFGTIGGSFVPIYVLPDWLQKIGEFTPNGQTLSVLIEWFHFEDLSLIWLPLTVLTVFTVISVIISMMLYPKRGEVS
ncbi:hypothetical protein KP77_11950 [Jeotgalibacillus alimentarius]|uniref:ABC-2 type transporter transmembrane domain-containing protein n=1 Tax=Jeotgalibacillus alimentarius TaxID=135826 RepID=A0A0C2W6M4_9BACL|nr:ABC transporter permease [Jeotgalibacillus alimentarius]KIL51683.1 hypothetical protein KP77_11950 [Jeotgalibacillus alimentarius]